MNYRKYTWAGNKIKDSDMAKLHSIKEETGKKITDMVSEDVGEYVSKKNMK